jgi:DNA-binding CsgD family transcriptional regulator
MDDIDFALSLQAINRPQAVITHVATRTAPVGFPIVAIWALPPPDDPYPRDFLVHNFPAEWERLYFEDGIGPHDPTRLSAQVVGAPITLTEVLRGEAGFLPTPQTLHVVAVATSFGGSEALIVPVFGPHGYRGVVTFVGPGPEPDPRTRMALHHLGIHAHNHLLDLHTRKAAVEGNAALSPREIAVLAAARRGARDEDIATELGITARTVRHHFVNARRKLHSRTRLEAIARATNLHLLGR